MTPFSASNQGGMTEATKAQLPAPAPSLPAFSIPTFGKQHLRLRVDDQGARRSPAVPGLSLAPFALAAHQHGVNAVEDGPVAFSIAASLLGTAPDGAQPAASAAAPQSAYDMDLLAHFDEFQVEPEDGAESGVVETVAPVLETSAPFVAQATGQAVASGPALMTLFKSALRTRIIAFGRVPRQRSAQEWVFLMLAFAVMSLLAAPPLVAIFLSLHGVKP